MAGFDAGFDGEFDAKAAPPVGSAPRRKLHCTVGEPLSDGASLLTTGSLPVVTYRVCIGGLDAVTGKLAPGASSVRRRYSDFEWLAKVLEQRYPGLLVPPLPPKTEKILIQDLKAFSDHRAKLLERFLADILAAPWPRDDDAVSAFINEKYQPADSHEEPGSPNMPGLVIGRPGGGDPGSVAATSHQAAAALAAAGIGGANGANGADGGGGGDDDASDPQKNGGLMPGGGDVDRSWTAARTAIDAEMKRRLDGHSDVIDAGWRAHLLGDIGGTEAAAAARALASARAAPGGKEEASEAAALAKLDDSLASASAVSDIKIGEEAIMFNVQLLLKLQDTFKKLEDIGTERKETASALAAALGGWHPPHKQLSIIGDAGRGAPVGFETATRAATAITPISTAAASWAEAMSREPLLFDDLLAAVEHEMARAEAAQELKERAVDARKAAVDAQDELVRLRAEKSTGVKTDKGPLAAIGDFFKARARARRVAAVGEGS